MENKRPNPEEIDLLYFFNPIIKAAKNYIYRLYKNLFLFFLILIACGVIGYFLRFFLPKYYKTSAIFASSLPAKFSSSIINSLQDLAEHHQNNSVLAEQLNISPAVASTISNISTQEMDSLSYMSIRDTSVSAFKVNLMVSDPNSILAIEKGLKNFLEKNEYLSKRREAKKSTLEALRIGLIQKIQGLDSLKDILNTTIIPRSTGQGVILGEPISPIDAYELMQNFYKDQKEIEEQLALLQNIEILEPFMKIKASNYPDFNKILFYSILIGTILALIIAPLTAKV